MDQAHLAHTAGRRRAILVATLLSCIIALGGYLRLRDLGAPGLWFDEGITLEQATRPDLTETVQASTTHPPLARLLVRASLRLVGETNSPSGKDFAARLPSALLGILAIPWIFLCARRLAGGDDLVGLTAAGIYAVIPFGVYYSQEARYYSGLVLFAAWAYHGALLVAERPRAVGRQVYLFVGLLLGLYNHHFGVVPLLASLLWLLPILWAAPRRNWVVLLPWAAASLAFLPWLTYAFGNLEDQSRPWIPGAAQQIRDVLAGWFTGRVGFYHLQRANWNQVFGLTVAVSSGLLIGAGLIVHAIRRRRQHGLWTVLALLGPMAGAVILHDLTVSTRFLHHKYLAFLYPLVALCLAELLALFVRLVAGLALWPTLARVWRRRGQDPGQALWHRDWLLAAGAALLLAFLVIAGRPALVGALEAHERHRWGSATYLPREHYQEVARWIQSRRGPGLVAVLVFDPHQRKNNTWLLRYYGVKEPLVSISDWVSRDPSALSQAKRQVLVAAKEVFVVTAHASPEDHARTVALARQGFPTLLGEFGQDGAEGYTRAAHLGPPRR